MPRKKYDSRKVNIVGSFFEDITAEMVRAERAPVDEGDFYIREGDIGIEVKGSDANHEWRLPLHQIELYQRMSRGFPLDNFFFFLFCYKNPYIKNDNSSRITSLSRIDDQMKIRSFIVANLDTLYVVDIMVIQNLFSVCRISDKSIPLHRGVKSLNIRPKHLRILAREKSFISEFMFADLLESYKIKLDVAIIGRTKATRGLIKCFKPGILT